MSRSDRNQITAQLGRLSLQDRLRAERHAVRVANGTAAKPRPKCTCPAYQFPHRPKGGLCRWPDPPLQTWQGQPGKSKASILRCTRGVRRRLLKQHGWHPIRDRAKIHRWMPKLYVAWWRRDGYSFRPDLPAMRITAETDMHVPPPERVPAIPGGLPSN